MTYLRSALLSFAAERDDREDMQLNTPRGPNEGACCWWWWVLSEPCEQTPAFSFYIKLYYCHICGKTQ